MVDSTSGLIGIEPVINASGTLTTLGGNRLSKTVIQAINEASSNFYDMNELHLKAGKFLASLIDCESAYITNGVGAGIVLTVAASRCHNDITKASKLPCTTDLPNEVVIQKLHYNQYAPIVKAAGAEIVLAGNEAATTKTDLENEINEKTACILYFAYDPQLGVLNLDNCIEIAHSKGLPLIIDASAETFPQTRIRSLVHSGADAVLFSLGKDVAGPNDTGVIFGKKEIVDFCRRIGPHGYITPGYQYIGRPLKLSKEDIFGAITAFIEYMQVDPIRRMSEFDEMVTEIEENLEEINIFKTRIIHPDVDDPHLKHHRPDTIPRIKIYDFLSPLNSEYFYHKLLEGSPKIYTYTIGDSLFINPQCLTRNEMKQVLQRIFEIVKELKP